MKKVRMLLRVSSGKQLEADGDLSVQRQLVEEYIKLYADWQLDEKEYFEGSNSGYSNTVDNRDVLQEALRDAREGQYDILVAYKDDRIGRRMWEIGAYVMALKSVGVDIFTVKDGCISPETDDVMGQMMLALRYGNAQKSSADTGMRVKDTAQKMIRRGKFMGGSPPYGYRLELSGEISKHGRALHRLVIEQEQAAVVRYIYELFLYQDYGSGKIAKQLNEDTYYRNLAPNDVWKSGTVTSILTNPVYTGYMTYKRREQIGNKCHRLDSTEWIKAEKPDETIRIVEESIFKRVREKRKSRREKYAGAKQEEERKSRSVCEKQLLTAVLYCGCCKEKMIGTVKYNYWKLKESGEKRSSKIPVYRCQAAGERIVHEGKIQFRADQTEEIVFAYIGDFLNDILEKYIIISEIEKIEKRERQKIENEWKKYHRELQRTRCKIEKMKNYIPEAVIGEYSLTVNDIEEQIQRLRELAERQKRKIREKEKQLQEKQKEEKRQEVLHQFPSWKAVLKVADPQVKKMLAELLLARVELSEKEILIRFKIGNNRCFVTNNGGFGVPEQRL